MGIQTGQTNLALQPAGTTQMQVSAQLAAQLLVTPGSGQTVLHVHAVGTGAAATLATVSTGKTAYIIVVEVGGTAAAAPVLLTSADASIFYIRHAANASVFIASPVPLASYASGTNIRWNGLATSEIDIWYVEV